MDVELLKKRFADVEKSIVTTDKRMDLLKSDLRKAADSEGRTPYQTAEARVAFAHAQYAIAVSLDSVKVAHEAVAALEVVTKGGEGK